MTEPGAHRLRFSIVIPAHNEERYIARTLEHVAMLSYPKDAYETLVVENGSTDRTFDIAKQFEGGTISVMKSDNKGVSPAKNLGIDRMAPASDWVIFLDADTLLGKEFLNELNAFLLRRGEGYVVGTTAIRPVPETLKASLWFHFYDLGHRIMKNSYSIKIVKRSLFPPLRFDESLANGEDLHLTAQARAYGGFFFLPTRSVFTSTRRFDAVGWWKTFFLWTFVWALPVRMRRGLDYRVVR